jgi:hypothetical protein
MRQIWVDCIDSLCHAKRIWFYTFHEANSLSFGWFSIYTIKVKVSPSPFFKANINLLYPAVYQSRFLNLKRYFSWFYYLHSQSNFDVFLIFKCSNFHLFRSFSRIFFMQYLCQFVEMVFYLLPDKEDIRGKL